MNLSPLALPCSRIFLMQGGVYCLPCGGWALGFLPTYLVFVPSSIENISQRELNRQPLHLEMGASPLSPGSLGSSNLNSKHLSKVVDSTFNIWRVHDGVVYNKLCRVPSVCNNSFGNPGRSLHCQVENHVQRKKIYFF